MEFMTVLNELTNKIGLGEATLEDNGSLSLLFDGVHEVSFTPDAEDRSVLLSAEVGDAIKLSKDDCLALLKASLLGAETGGAALAVHDKLDKVVLWKRYDQDFRDLSALEAAINSFLAQTIHWKEKLTSPNWTAKQFDTSEELDANRFAINTLLA